MAGFSTMGSAQAHMRYAVGQRLTHAQVLRLVSVGSHGGALVKGKSEGGRMGCSERCRLEVRGR
jgi:hypothetical protein